MLTALRIAIFVAGLGGGGLLFHAYNVFVDNPAIVKIEQERAAAIAEAAAAKATREEQLRQFQIAERAANAFYEKQLEDAAFEAAREELYRQEIEDYERELAALNRSFALTQRDLDFLDGRLVQPGGPAARGGGR